MTKEELKAIKEEVETVSRKLHELTEEELAQVSGGQGIGSLGNINPDDIETINILKDASATPVYGIRGANGVILVTSQQE